MLNIIKNEGDEKDLNNKQLAIIQLFQDQYSLTNTVVLYETSHGHIVHLERKKHIVSVNPNNAVRITKKDIDFLADVSYRFRWIEFHAAYLTIGL